MQQLRKIARTSAVLGAVLALFTVGAVTAAPAQAVCEPIDQYSVTEAGRIVNDMNDELGWLYPGDIFNVKSQYREAAENPNRYFGNGYRADRTWVEQGNFMQSKLRYERTFTYCS